VPQPNVDANVLLGDLLIVAGGALWAATTTDRQGQTALIKAPAEKGPRLPGGAVDPDPRCSPAWISVERITHVPGPLSAVAAWPTSVLGGRPDVFAVVRAGQNLFRQQAVGNLPSSTPLFGVVASYFIMHDTLTLAFGAAALLVIAGLYLVNRPETSSAKVGAGSPTFQA